MNRNMNFLAKNMTTGFLVLITLIEKEREGNLFVHPFH
jgi:hypothetical protein